MAERISRRRLLGLGVGALAAYGGVRLGLQTVDFIEGRKQSDSLKSELDSAFSFIESVNSFLEERVAFIETYEPLLQKDNYAEILPVINSKRKDLVLRGITFAQRLLDTGTIKVAKDGTHIQVKGEGFDLEDHYDLFLLDQLALRVIDANLPVKTSECRREAAVDFDNLLWLKKQAKPAIFVDEGVFTLPPDQLFSEMARFYRTIDELGHRPAKSISIRRYQLGDPGDAWYVYDTTEPIILTERALAAVVHEEGHHQAHVNRQFSQARFNRIVDDALKKANLIVDNSGTVINPVVLSHESPEKIMGEDYAETLEVFWEDGVEFRRILTNLYLKDSAYGVLLAKYEFAKRFYGGREFIVDGELFDPKIGDAFIISDPEGLKNGIALRPSPQFGDTSGYPVIYDRDRVTIIEGPREVQHPAFGKVLMWKVEDSYGNGGWIWGIWLGVKVAAGTKSHFSSTLSAKFCGN